MDKSDGPPTPESTWKSMNGDGKTSMDITFTPDQLCAMARSREREGVWPRRILLLVLVGLSGGFAYNAFSVIQLSMRLSQVWMFIWSCLLIWRLRQRPQRRNAIETCASFLRREYESKRSAFLEIRRYLFLLIPPILASWWDDGLASRVKAVGVHSSSRLYHFATGQWPFIVIGLLLALIWLAFGLAAKQATRELDELSRRTQE